MPPLDTETLLQLVEATSPPNAKTEATDDVPDALLVALTGHDDSGGEQGGPSRLQRLWVQTVWEALKKAGMSADDGVVPITHPRDKLRLQSQRHAAFEAIKLDDATAQHSAIADKYNAMALPSLETLATELRTNRWLCALLHHVVRQAAQGFEGGAHATPDSFGTEANYLRDLEYAELVAVVPYVRRLGYAVVLFSDFDPAHPFNVAFMDQPQHWCLKLHREDLLNHARTGELYAIRLRGTAPDQIRRRGLLKCVPRLLGWLRQARIALADPRRPGAVASLVKGLAATLAETHPPHWKSAAAEWAVEQASRKRKLAEALHASEDDRRKGVRWFNVQEHHGKSSASRAGEPLVTNMMRIEALAGDHCVFQRERQTQYLRELTYEVVVLHNDAFDIGTWDAENWNRKACEQAFAQQFGDEASEEEDGSEDEDEEAQG